MTDPYPSFRSLNFHLEGCETLPTTQETEKSLKDISAPPACCKAFSWGCEAAKVETLNEPNPKSEPKTKPEPDELNSEPEPSSESVSPANFVNPAFGFCQYMYNLLHLSY